MNEPTPDDMARDLAADLTEFKRLARAVPEWVGGTMREPDLALFARQVTGAAIRRALAAEDQAEAMRNECHMLRLENSRMREDVRGIIAEECQTLGSALADVTAERDRLRAILDAPRVMLFADGREPTTNERHLANLLAWRQKEAGEARAELAGVRAELDHLSEAARAVLSVLRDRLDGTADEPLVDRLQAAVEGGVR